MNFRHLLLAFAITASPVWAQDAAPAEAPDAPENAAEEPAAVVLPDIALGAEDAPLTVVEYASFTCSHCANFHTENWPRLKEQYVDTGKVKFIQREVYFDAVGLWAGILARCGGDEKYYAVSDMLFSQQSDWISGGTSQAIAENLRRIGSAAGFSTEEMDSCWADEAQVERMLATFQQHSEADGVEATPTFIIGGEKVPNQAWADMKEIIEAKLAEAQE